MVHEEHAQGATPQESSQPTTKLPSSDQPSREWRHKVAHHYDKGEPAVYRHHHGIIQQIRDIALSRCPLVGKQPAEMGVDEASYPAPFVADMGAMRIARLIGVSMVLAMVRHPVWDRPLNRRRAENGKDASDQRVGLEAAVSE